MKDYENVHSGASAPVGSAAGPIFRGIASIMGILVILVGLVFSVMVFNSIHGSLKDPGGLGESVDKWSEAVGGESLDVILGGEPFPLARVLGIMVVGGATLLLCWLSLGIMVTGAKIISWSTGDREAVKKIIREAMGTRIKV